VVFSGDEVSVTWQDTEISSTSNDFLLGLSALRAASQSGESAR
jgi:hypothetical protein